MLAAADLAENRPYVRPKPVKILSIRELQRKSVDVPSDQPFSFVRFHGTFARLKCIRPPVAPPSPPQSPTAHLPPSIPMPEKEAKPLKEIPVLGPGPGQPLQGPPADAPPHEQSVVLEEKPPIQKVVMVRFLEEQSGMPSSSTSLIMQQHDYARPSTSRGTMSQEEIEDIHASKF